MIMLAFNVTDADAEKVLSDVGGSFKIEKQDPMMKGNLNEDSSQNN